MDVSPSGGVGRQAAENGGCAGGLSQHGTDSHFYIAEQELQTEHPGCLFSNALGLAWEREFTPPGFSSQLAASSSEGHRLHFGPETSPPFVSCLSSLYPLLPLSSPSLSPVSEPRGLVMSCLAFFPASLLLWGLLPFEMRGEASWITQATR